MPQGKGPTLIQPNVFLTGTHRLLVTKTEGATFRRTINCQIQLRTSKSVSVLWARYEKFSKLQAISEISFIFVCILGQCFIPNMGSPEL